MGKNLNLIAFDMGASNGRCILGEFDGKKIKMSEIHRFDNSYIDLSGVLYWNIAELFKQMKLSFSKYRGLNLGNIDSFGIDTWGVDYGLLDKHGQLTSLPRSYRYSTTEDLKKLTDRISAKEIYLKTGEASEVYTTLCQLYKRHTENDAGLHSAETMLLTPDLLGYFFTGIKRTEYTEATTTMMYNPFIADWDRETFRKLGMDDKILTEIDLPGKIRGPILKSISDELGINQANNAVVGSHDTASAVAAIPGRGNFAFCSSGTWSLIGVETDEPVINDKMYEWGFTNEGTVQGGFRILKNIMGLWHIQECRKEWAQKGISLSWDDIVDAAKATTPLTRIIDTDSSDFYLGGNMIEKINNFLIRTNQKPAETIGEVSRCIYDSLALKYRWSVERLSEIKGSKIDMMNIVGGGIQNKLLNQLIADSINLPVVTGPVEGAAIGNLLTQAMALGELSNVQELREVVRASETVNVYEPHHSEQWDVAYDKLKQFI